MTHTHTQRNMREMRLLTQYTFIEITKKNVREKENERYASSYYYISVENLSFLFLLFSSKKTSTDLEKMTLEY